MLDRIFSFIVLSLFHSGNCVPVCPVSLVTGTTGWFTNLVFCGLTKTPANRIEFTNAEIQSCLTNMNGNQQTLNSNLQTAISTLPACATCIFSFVRSVNKLPVTGTSCSTTWIPVTSLASWNSPLCLGDLYEAISAFNSCANNGFDIRTGDVSTRCRYEDYVKVERDFRPWPAMVQLANNNVLVSQYAEQVGSFFPNQLASMPCKSCYDNLYASMKGSLGSGSKECSTSPYDAVCTSFLIIPLTLFGQCTGGLSMRTTSPYWCKSTEVDLVETVYRPYKSLVACSVFYNANTMGQFETCMRGYNGLVDLPATTCAPCFVTFVMTVLSQQSQSCSSNPLSGPCVESLTGYRGALPQFAMCAGYDMSTTQNVCTLSEQTRLASKYKSYIPMVRASMSAFNLLSAGQLLANDLSLSNLRVAVTHLTCGNCFRAFMIDVWQLVYNSGTKMNFCANPASDECEKQVLKQVLGRFVDCAGFHLTNDSPAACTLVEASNAVLASYVASKGLEYTNGTDFAVAFPDIYREVQGSISYMCQGCFKLFGIFVANLNSAQKEICRNFAEPMCYQFLAPALLAFSDCSGSSLPEIGTPFQQSTIDESTMESQANPDGAKSSPRIISMRYGAQILPIALLILIHT